ncbi:hypothetical protein D3C81_526700 [compost metagenome]
MAEAVGADPLCAPLRTGVATPLHLALPLGTRRRAATGQADGLAVDLATARIQLAIAEGKARVPAQRRIEIHAEGVGQARFLAGFQELALIEHVDLVRQAPALAQRPAILRVRAEQRVVLAAVGGLGERTIETVLWGQLVLGIDLRSAATITITDLGTDRGQVGKGVGTTRNHRVVVGIAAMIVIDGQLAATIEVQRGADAMGVARCRQHTGIAADTAVLLHPTQLGRHAIVVADPPFGGGLRLDQRFIATPCFAVTRIQTEIVGHVAQQFRALLTHALAGVKAAHRIASLDLPPPGTGTPVALGPAQFAQVHPCLHRGRLAIARPVGVEAGEAQATVVGEEHRRTGRLAAAVLDLQVGTTPGLQRQVRTAQRIVLASALFVHIGGAHRHVVAEPVLAAHAGGDVVIVEAGRHPFVIDDQALLVAVQRHVAADPAQVLAADLGQWPGQQDAALQRVDLVVGTARQRHPLLDTAGGAVTDLQHHLVRAAQDAGMAQVIQAATGADELAVARRGLGLRTEQAQFGLRIAPGIGAARAPRQCRTVQRAHVLGVLGTAQAGVVVAPQCLVLVPVHAQVEAAHAVDVTLDQRIVAIGGVIQVRVQAAEQVLRIGGGEAGEQFVQRPVLRIGLCRQQIAATRLGLQVERQPPIT